MRVSTNQYDSEERLSSGFDYEHQAWVWNGVYVRCGHPESMACGCYGRAHEGEKPGAQSARSEAPDSHGELEVIEATGEGEEVLDKIRENWRA